MTLLSDMFRVRRCHRRGLLIGLILFCAVALAPGSALALPTDAEMAKHIAGLLGEKFEPESVSVRVRESRAYAEMKGAVLSKIRIDTMRLDSLLTNSDKPLVNDADSLASLIGYSKGEIVLLEKDVNQYFDNNDTKGFSRLVFDFTPKGFRAEGVFTADFLFTIRIRLAAVGVLALEPDGVCLDDVEIYVEKLKQSASLAGMIIARVNPLIEWKDIPFKVEFKKVTMGEESAVMTGFPEKLEGGSVWVWKKK